MGCCNSGPVKPGGDDGTTGSGGRSTRLAETLDGRVNTVSDEERRRLNDIVEERKFEKALAVQTIKIPVENEKKHHTAEFERDDVTIVRRGQQFHLTTVFDRKIDVENDMVRLQLTYGKNPLESKGSLIRIPVNLNSTDRTTDIGKWWRIDKTKIEGDGQSLEIFVTSPRDAFIGYYDMYIETMLKGNNDISRTKHKRRIVMLFNPWNKDDTVYMANDEERREYVMNQTGAIWVGSRWRNSPRAWNFGQFQSPVLSAALRLLERAQLTDDAMNNPVIISRKISAFANVNDDYGVLVGNWSGNYSRGTSPTTWLGSVEIIKKFMKSNGPVKYGQCWVFSGITTTLLRALGIPTRSVTNFGSAHDHDVSMTIDKYIDENDEVTDKFRADSIWNFHVWNECWFRRFDLPPGYDGWQVVDATPQEDSDGIKQCGPAPVRAVKEGHVYLTYDTPFVYAEVNGDVIYWRVFRDNRPDELVDIHDDKVGFNISTKAVGSRGRNDITSDYKYKTGSAEADKVRAFISNFSTERIKNLQLTPEKEIKVEIQIPENSLFGEDFVIHNRIQNTANEERRVTVTLTILHCHYTGVSAKRVKIERFNETVGPQDDFVKPITVTFNEYKSTPNPDSVFQVYLTAKNETTKRITVKDTVFDLEKPDIEITVRENTLYYNKETVADVKVINTTSISLTNCTFRIESIGALEEVMIRRKKPLGKGEEWTEKVVLKPFKKTQEECSILAGFQCEQLPGITGSSDDFPIKHLQPRTTEED